MPRETTTEIESEEDLTFSPNRNSAKTQMLLKKNSPNKPSLKISTPVPEPPKGLFVSKRSKNVPSFNLPMFIVLFYY